MSNTPSKCPDDHDVMKPIPNRADRRRKQRKRPVPAWVTAPHIRARHQTSLTQKTD